MVRSFAGITLLLFIRSLSVSQQGKILIRQLITCGNRYLTGPSQVVTVISREFQRVGNIMQHGQFPWRPRQ